MDMRRVLLNKVTVSLLAVIIAVAAYLLYEKNQRPTAARYKTEQVSVGDISQTVSANGTLNPVVLVSVGTQVSGTVKKLYADFNDSVKRGQILMELDDSLFQAQVKQSQANVDSAKASLELATANAARNTSPNRIWIRRNRRSRPRRRNWNWRRRNCRKTAPISATP